jgi:hypothetical protein
MLAINERSFERRKVSDQTTELMKYTILLTLGLAFALPLHAEETTAPATEEKATPAEADKGTKEKASPEEAFNKKDANKDSFLSIEEFVGKAADEAKTKAEAMFSKKDKNADSKLSLEEFSSKAGKGGKGGKKKAE